MLIDESFPLHPGEGSPILIGAGVLKTPEDLQPFFAIEDPLVAPTLTLGSFTVKEHGGNKAANGGQDSVYYPDKKMMGNALGLPNPGIEGMRRLTPSIRELSERGIRTIISVTNLPQENGLETIPRLVEAAAELEPTAIEINLSCPNGLDVSGAMHPPICNDPELSEELLLVSRYRVGKEVLLGGKDSPHAANLENGIDRTAIRGLMLAIYNHLNFVTTTNTIGNQPFPEITAGNGRAGMSGPVIAPIARACLATAAIALPEEIAILSVGGVDRENVAEEVSWRLQEGALLVGGAQEFYRSPNPARLAIEWARRAA